MARDGYALPAGSERLLLTPELLAELQTPAGLRVLTRAAELEEDAFAALRLRQELPGCSGALAAAAVDQARFRRRAAGKFRRAAGMWFSGPLLEQASGEVVARHRARRFRAWDRVGDLCCGLGMDAVALADHAEVVAIDRDPLALALTRANAETWGVGNGVLTEPGELPAAAPALPAAWVDPGRREGGTRTRRLDAISPTLAEVLSLCERIPHLGIKLSPASSHEALEAELMGISHEREFLSVSGECRELAVWTGELATAGGGRRATLLSEAAEPVSLEGAPEPTGVVRPAGEWLWEPNPAVIRAGLVGNLAAELGAWPVDEQLAYLSTERWVETPFARGYRVSPPEPFSLKELSRRLRGLEAGNVVLKTRGAAASPEELRQQLRRVLKQGRPERCPVVFITRLGGRAMMILGASFGPGAE